MPVHSPGAEVSKAQACAKTDGFLRVHQSDFMGGMSGIFCSFSPLLVEPSCSGFECAKPGFLFARARRSSASWSSGSLRSEKSLLIAENPLTGWLSALYRGWVDGDRGDGRKC